MSEDKDIRRRTISGLGWTASSQLVLQATQFAFTATLARLLVPHEFGLMALIAVFTGFVTVFVDFGLTAAIIQRPRLEERHLTTAFWTNLLAGVVLMLVMMGAAPGVAAFFGQPRLLGLTLAVSPDFVLGAAGMVQMALLQRQMDFRRIAIVENTTLLASNGLAVGLAASGFGVWSLAAYFLASTGFRSLALWVATPWRPGWRIDRGAFGDLWQFSSRLAAFNALNYWARNADNLLIGRFVGTAPLAYYNRAYNLMLLPVGLVASVTSRVMFPALSRLHEDQEQVKRVYLRATGLIALVTFPAMIGLLVVANPFILSVYGERWRPVVPILQILCIPSIVQCLTRTTGWIFQSQGRADWMFRWGVVSTVTVIVSFFIGLPWGVKGVSVAYACWTVLMASPSFSIAGRLIGVTLADVARSVIGVATASAAMGAVVWLVLELLPTGWGAGLDLAICVATGALAYAAALHVVSPSPYGEFRRLVGEYHRRRAHVGVASS
ncbi:MAG TPA: MOP flippase family protein [Gaiellaceae bacterium]|nr:MOP flippase family protein [Gaiellaceae bacterium]